MSQLEIKCPQCGRLTFYNPKNKYRPFCSDRCKLIDLGQWASEGYKIPVKTASDYISDLNPDEFSPLEENPLKNRNDDSAE